MAVTGIVTDREVVVHPIVLLSVVDHYTRAAKGTNKRVAGCLLGEVAEGQIHVSNSFAIPFDEDPRDPLVWFLDRGYLEQMLLMFRKISKKERVVGWYSTGPKIRPADLEIHEVFRRYCAQPVYAIVDVSPKQTGMLTNAYYSYEVPCEDRAFRRTFVHIPSRTGAYEIEEVGVEHLLRDLKNASTSTITTQITDKLSALQTLVNKLDEMSQYLDEVINDRLPMNSRILDNFQNIYNNMPDVDLPEVVEAVHLHANDNALALYVGSVVRTVIALHNLVNNKLDNKRAHEKAQTELKEKKEKEEKEKKEKDKKDKKEQEEAANENTDPSSKKVDKE